MHLAEFSWGLQRSGGEGLYHFHGTWRERENFPNVLNNAGRTQLPPVHSKLSSLAHTLLAVLIWPSSPTPSYRPHLPLPVAQHCLPPSLHTRAGSSPPISHDDHHPYGLFYTVINPSDVGSAAISLYTSPINVSHSSRLQAPSLSLLTFLLLRLSLKRLAGRAVNVCCVISLFSPISTKLNTTTSYSCELASNFHGL